MTPTPKRSRKTLWRIISVVLALMLLIYVLSRIELDDLQRVIAGLGWWSIAAGFIMYLLLNLFRAYRYIALLDRADLPLHHVYAISMYHNFFVRLLPFKLGEMVYIVLMRKRLNVSTSEGVSSLFAARMLELLVIVLVFLGALLLSTNLFDDVLLLGGLAVFCILIGVGSLYYAGSIIHRVARVLRRWPRAGVFHGLADRLDSLAVELERIHDPVIFVRGLIWSIFTYGSSFASNAILLYAAANVTVDPVTLTIIVSMGMFATAIPINISGFGAVELSLAFAMTTYLDVGLSHATTVGLLINGMTLFYALLCGVIGFVVIQILHIQGDAERAAAPWWREAFRRVQGQD